jgi:hypothetical protein
MRRQERGSVDNEYVVAMMPVGDGREKPQDPRVVEPEENPPVELAEPLVDRHALKAPCKHGLSDWDLIADESLAVRGMTDRNARWAAGRFKGTALVTHDLEPVK